MKYIRLALKFVEQCDDAMQSLQDEPSGGSAQQAHTARL